MSTKAVRLKNINVSVNDAMDWVVQAMVEDASGNIRCIKHTYDYRPNEAWEADLNMLINAVIREARDFS